MKGLCKSVLGVMLVALTLLASCGSKAGSEYVGKWANIKNRSDILEIERSGQNFVVRGKSLGEPVSFPAILNNGTLRVSIPFGQITVIIDKTTGHLIMAGSEYKRLD